MVLAVLLVLGGCLVGSLCLTAYAVQKLHKLAENAFVLSRAKSAEDYTAALEVAKPVPKVENIQKEPEPENVTIDGRVYEPVTPWIR